VAETWRVTPRKVAIAKVIDAVGGALWRKRALPPIDPFRIREILVLEPWHIGDVVIATAALVAIRAKFPNARVALLGKQYAAEMLMHSGLVDEVIVADLPWTAKSAKYDPRRYDLEELRTLIDQLRRRRFDLTVDARMDLRSNTLTYLSNAPRRVGFAFGGGSFLLTDAVPAEPELHHRVDDWLSLVLPLTGDAIEHDASGSDTRYMPFLAVSSEESRWADDLLASHGIEPADRVVAFHGGASDPRRMWPRESFEDVARSLASRRGVKTVFLLEPGAADRRIEVASAVVRTSLREMMAILARCDLLVCNDSGPMHIADALGVPVVAVFLTGNPVWHRPYHPGQRVVGRGTGHDFAVAPTVAEVLAAAEEQLDSRRARR
jgi:heptosyltransferase-2